MELVRTDIKIQKSFRPYFASTILPSIQAKVEESGGETRWLSVDRLVGIWRNQKRESDDNPDVYTHTHIHTLTHGTRVKEETKRHTRKGSGWPCLAELEAEATCEYYLHCLHAGEFC